MSKRILSFLLVFAMLFGMLPMSVFAADDTQSSNLRVLTFEDEDYEGGTNYAGGTDWSSLIDESQYGGSLLYPSDADTAYNWYDKGNTELAHEFADEWGDHQYWGGGHAISNYVSGDWRPTAATTPSSPSTKRALRAWSALAAVTTAPITSPCTMAM